MNTNREELLQAVNDLIFEPDPEFKRNALESAGQVRKVYPLKLTGELAVLNPLLNLMLDDPEGFTRVQALIDNKRLAAGLEAIWPQPAKLSFKDRKNEYQSEFMRVKRARSGRAIAIENMQRGEADKLEGHPRAEFDKMVTRSWNARHKTAQDLASAAAGRALSREEQRVVREAFWATIDRELDDLEEQVRREMLKPSHMRRKI